MWHTNRQNFIIIYIPLAWQGKGKISKNVTYIHTELHHYIYIVSLAGGRQNKQKCNKHTHIHFIIIYISPSLLLPGRLRAPVVILREVWCGWFLHEAPQNPINSTSDALDKSINPLTILRPPKTCSFYVLIFSAASAAPNKTLWHPNEILSLGVNLLRAKDTSPKL